MQLHQKRRSLASKSDEYETPQALFQRLCAEYRIIPVIDVASIPTNQKTGSALADGLAESWYADAWCNPPHSRTKEFVLKADAEWIKNNINVLMIIPANALTTQYFDKVIDHVEYYPIKNRITFLVDGSPSKDHSRNGYFVIVWRKR